jgi:hypothetical protein
MKMINQIENKWEVTKDILEIHLRNSLVETQGNEPFALRSGFVSQVP